jgi:hypothetical protein
MPHYKYLIVGGGMTADGAVFYRPNHLLHKSRRPHH